MPVLHQYKDGSGYFVKSFIEGAIVTFQLTEPGQGALLGLGVQPGERFAQSFLIDLYRRGEAFTKRGGTRREAGYFQAEQYCFDFARAQEANPLIPCCALTGSFDDLHLVVHSDLKQDERSVAVELLSPDARHGLEHRTILLSVPLTVLSAEVLDRLRSIGKIPKEGQTLKMLQRWLSVKPPGAWRGRKPGKTRQEGLEFALEVA